MQIDFHHGVTYVVARLAGFAAAEAEVIAYAAQYVDDATNAGLLVFDNGAMYERISSAHRMLDYRNFEALANHRVWIPFHFLPGNGGLPAGEDPPGTFIEKLRCTPNSHVARDMLRACIAGREAPSGLHRLGITMHVYADTWAHQGFAGVNHEINYASGLVGADGEPDLGLINRLTGYFVGTALPLGHGAVLSNPDKPWLVWGYTNGRGQVIARNNPRDFVQAANAMCMAMQQYRAGSAEADVPGLMLGDLSLISEMIRGIQDNEGEDRHARWLAAVADGAFSFGPASPTYIDKGEGSWKYHALGTTAEVDDDDDEFVYDPAFMRSHWKLFHDALQEHRFDVLHHILPRYGICAA
jgi:hypothetical protein